MRAEVGGGPARRGRAPAVISLLPGAGDVGAALVKDPGVHTIAFTGSVQVGLEIVRSAAEPVPGQQHIKRVVAELGGKNCVLVDADADLDEAVPEIISSAFAYAGQKCSAAARALVHEAIFEPLLERLAGAVRVLVVGQASELQTAVPPVIEQAAKERVDHYPAQAAKSGRIVACVENVPQRGWFCPPAIVSDLPSDSPVAGRGGVRSSARGRTDSRFRAGTRDRRSAAVRVDRRAVRARSRDRPLRVRPHAVGNLYVNRGITGAKVGRQPFGGKKLSGTGGKAGGPDTCSSSWSRGRLRRTPCGTDWW